MDVTNVTRIGRDPSRGCDVPWAAGCGCCGNSKTIIEMRCSQRCVPRRPQLDHPKLEPPLPLIMVCYTLQRVLMILLI